MKPADFLRSTPAGTLALRVVNGGGPVVVAVADAYGPSQKLTVHGSGELLVATNNSGGCYDVTLTTASDPTFSYQLAGRIESPRTLTSDPQLGR